MRHFSVRKYFLVLMAAAMLLAPSRVHSVFAQNSPAEGKDAGTSIEDHKKSRKKPAAAADDELTDEERKERLRSFKKEVGKAYQVWLEEDVKYIISPQEERAFKLLGTDEEREAFIDQFWIRRSPNPDSEQNEFREEHYRRFQYANEHFAAGIPGWRTDRGHIYIVWGPPDEINSRPSGGTYQRPNNEGGGSTSTFPFETWRYRHLEGIGEDVTIEFVDACQCNDYHISLDPNEKDALLHIPNGGSTLMEQMGMGQRSTRMTGIPGAMDPNGAQSGANQFSALERYAKLTAAPPIRFKDLEEKVNTRIRYNLMPFDMRADFVKLTGDTVLVPITIQIKTRDMTFAEKDGIQRAVVNIFGRVTTIAGRTAATFEDVVGVDEPSELLEKALGTSQVYWKALPLKPGMYKIDLALKDVNGDRVGTLVRSMRVPEFDDEKLSASSLILADLMERVAAKNIGAGSFILGDTKVRPRPDSADGKPAAFHRDQRLNIWLQVYNLQQDPQNHKTHAAIIVTVVNHQTGQTSLYSEDSSDSYGNNASQITIEKSLPLTNLAPGNYDLTVSIDDHVAKQTIAPSARFLLE